MRIHMKVDKNPITIAYEMNEKKRNFNSRRNDGYDLSFHCRIRNVQDDDYGYSFYIGNDIILMEDGWNKEGNGIYSITFNYGDYIATKHSNMMKHIEVF